MIAAGRVRVGGVVVALVALALLSSRASPGFPLADVPRAVGRTIVQAFGAARPPAPRPVPVAEQGASRYALADIPARYLDLYVRAAGTCPNLSWQVLAAIGKVESNHGRAQAPGVSAGLNRAGCCAGPMQFNITNGPPSTWSTYGRGNVYDPTDAIPAAAHKLCNDGLAGGGAVRDPCPTLPGSAALHQALRRYNNACWYVHEVTTLATRYTTTRPPNPSRDPFVVALTRNPHIQTTTTHGCDPRADLASGRLDLRVQSLLAVLAGRHTIRLSCAYTGHSTYVAGTRRVSNHHVWRAVDIDQVDHEPVTAHSHAARQLVAWLDGLQGPLRPEEIGSPFPIGHRPYFSDEGHREHVHIGYGAG